MSDKYGAQNGTVQAIPDGTVVGAPKVQRTYTAALPRAGREGKARPNDTKRMNRLSNVQVRKLLNYLDDGRDRLMKTDICNFTELAAVVSADLGFLVTPHQTNSAWVDDLELPTGWLTSNAQKRAHAERKAAEEKAAEEAVRKASPAVQTATEPAVVTPPDLGPKSEPPTSPESVARWWGTKRMADTLTAVGVRTEEIRTAQDDVTARLAAIESTVNQMAAQVAFMYAEFAPKPVNLTGGK